MESSPNCKAALTGKQLLVGVKKMCKDIRAVVDVSAFIVLVAGGDITAVGTSALLLYFDFKLLLFLHDPAAKKHHIFVNNASFKWLYFRAVRESLYQTNRKKLITSQHFFNQLV